MTTDEKARLFDVILVAFTHQWENKRWSWWCCAPCGGLAHVEPEKAIVEFLEWCEKIAKRKPEVSKVVSVHVNQ